MSPVYRMLNSQRLRAALEEKANKYGRLETPFLIAIYPETQFPTRDRHEIEALFGDTVWNVPIRGDGEVTETRKRNGFFNSLQNEKPRQTMVSAIWFYRFKWLEDRHVHNSHIIHNPFAAQPIDPGLFPDIPQLVFESSGTPKWLNGEPADPW